jgi:HEAT repeat protein
MLKPDQAKQILADSRVKEVETYQSDSIANLPDYLRNIAYGIIQRDAEGQPIKEYKTRNERQAECVAQLDVIAKADRLRIFSIFFPQIAPAIESGWQHMRSLPYQIGYSSTMFRAPARPDITAERRRKWFFSLLQSVGHYHQDLLWFAHHAAYINNGYAGSDLGVLFAAAIDGDPANGDAIFDILLDSAKGEDEIGTMGRHVAHALLGAASPDGWEFIGKLLLAAQRQEGLRQIILEGLDDAHPQAFRRLLQIVVENDLARFSAVTLALNGWLGSRWDSAQKTAINRMLQRLLKLLEDPEAREIALAQGSGEEVYLALWAIATGDALKAIECASPLIEDAQIERRFAAAHLLAETKLPEAAPALMRAAGDGDPRVVALACGGLASLDDKNAIARTLPIFEQIETILSRLPKQAPSVSPVIWEWLTPAIGREYAADLLIKFLGDRDPRRLLPYLPILGRYSRIRIAGQLAEAGSREPEIRAALFALLRDRSTSIESMITILDKYPIEPAEIPQFEALLTRRSTNVRRGLIDLIAKQPDDVALASADRLTAARDEQQRLAGLDLLRVLHEKQRSTEACVERAVLYRAKTHRKLTTSELVVLDLIIDAGTKKPVLADALGLTDPVLCAPIPAPKSHPVQLHTDRALAHLIALDALIHEHRDQPYETDYYGNKQEALLGENDWRFPHTDLHTPIAQDVARLPLAEIWRAWAEQLAADEDKLHFIRMKIVSARLGNNDSALTAALQASFGSDIPKEHRHLRYPGIVSVLCSWFIRLYPAPDTADFLLDHVETLLAALPEKYLREAKKDDDQVIYRRYEPLNQAIELARTYASDCDATWTDAHRTRLWLLLRWTARIKREALQNPPTLQETLDVHRAGVATESDIYMQILGPRPISRWGGDFHELHELSARKPHLFFERYPILTTIYANCVSRILEVELQRGEMPTEATSAALSLRSIAGAEWLIRILQALDAMHLKRGHSYGDDSKARSLSHLLRASFPSPDDMPDTFKKQAKVAKLAQSQLIEAAVYAPQWAHFVERALGWNGFGEAVWWIHAHTRDRNWYIDEAIREIWEAQIGERTPLSGTDLYDGAVDVAWFHRVYGALGKARWETLYAAAKFASGGIGHARAQLFADAMLGRIDAKDVITRIQTKRHHDSVCALGLVPLPAKQRDRAILQRYQVFQEFARTSRKFGAQRRESEGKAVRIGMDNLARTAGYSDPIRLQWAMELQEVADLRDGPVGVTYDGVAVMLRIDPLGQPHLDVTKHEKPLKQIPPRLKKEPEVIALRERKRGLDQQLSRMRLALEQAMCREETFAAGELARLLGHPILAPMLEQLIFAGDGVMGYLVAGGQALRTHDSRDLPIAPETSLRIAHPYDLYRAGDWSQWQRECFVAERIQPFKQIFRELYVLTEAERNDDTVSHRYAGQQIQPRQAMALLGQRGWLNGGYDEDSYYGASRTFHERGLTASVSYLYGGGTSVDVEGLTIDGVRFNKSGQWSGSLPLAEVPPVVFSETMRDIDLVVSVAHRGGVDPETSSSTVEMRTALIRETNTLLNLANVRLQKNHAIVKGELGEYSIHLGSGVVHLIPGGSLCIIPVHAQHRGRLFLPFADDDPKTAEIISKILLLSRDAEIKDPLILQQIYARA